MKLIFTSLSKFRHLQGVITVFVTNKTKQKTLLYKMHVIKPLFSAGVSPDKKLQQTTF